MGVLYINTGVLYINIGVLYINTGVLYINICVLQAKNQGCPPLSMAQSEGTPLVNGS